MITATPEQMIADLVEMARTAQIGNAQAIGTYLRAEVAALRGQVETMRADECEGCAEIAISAAQSIEPFETDAAYPVILGKNEAPHEIATAIRARAALATPAGEGKL